MSNANICPNCAWVRGDAQGTDCPYCSTTPVNVPNLAAGLSAYEDGSLDHDGTVHLFQYLVDSGMAWQLQGSYGRTAMAMIKAGGINPPQYRERA